uniref:Uncharacterized protein n=1 Tax=Ditylum brightwellii TaxID=49249 RepID=A0A7S2EDB8_9STRA|mmetsp:Transcript_24629/g.36719  ORF Transcript_24629/g.36719 Transcript_24629/m.36719 type:complete len:619 (+) Transcript_24629:98-1954(+)
MPKKQNPYDDDELVPLSANNSASSSPHDASVSKRSLTRYLAIGLIVMVGCYHLGRFTCMLEHQELLEEGHVESKSSGKSKSKKDEADHAMTPAKIAAARSAGQELLSLLDDYYQHHKGGASHILMGKGGWSKGWFDTLGKREEKMIDTMARALLNPHQSVFKIGLIGSSVAAGHDNCRYDNYPEQLIRTWQSVWNAAGMELQVQNAGQGGGCGDSHKNQVWCVQQNVSPDVDIVHYSWSYFEGNDGRNERESLVRWSHLLAKSPPVHFINVNFDTTCLWEKPDENALLNAYEEYGYNAFCMRYALINSLNRPIDRERPAEDVMFEGNHVGDGFHNYTRYYDSSEPDERRDSLGVILRNWHPGPLGFQIISDALSYTYTKALLAALERIERVMDPKTLQPTKNEEAPDAQWWKERPIVLARDLTPHDPLVCDPKYCTVDEPPKCLNLELPTFGYWGASITPPEDDLNPWKGLPQNWQTWKEGEDIRWHMVSRFEISYYEDQPEKCIFPDHCAGIRAASPQEGRVVFKLPKMEVGMIALCVCCGKEVAQAQILDNPYIEIQFNERILDNSTFDLYPEKKCVRIVNDHSGTVVGSTGHAYLSIRLLEGNTEEVTISHVITL